MSKLPIGIFILLSSTVLAQSNTKIAEMYFYAYQRLDFNEMSNLYADDAEFIDPTFDWMRPDGFHLKGKNNIISELKKGFEGTLKWKVDTSMKFTVGEYVIYGGHIIAETTGATWGKPEVEKLFFKEHFVTILWIKDGKVKEHRDYIDYVTAAKQLQKQAG